MVHGTERAKCPPYDIGRTHAEKTAGAGAPSRLPETAPARASFHARRRDVRRLRKGPERPPGLTQQATLQPRVKMASRPAGQPGSPEGLKVGLLSVKVPAVPPIALPFQLPVLGRPSARP
ncbi:uncharacterized protein LOC115944952 [Leptonychotes weddellii]|uniref:Uncharacterized protein LOC115944952 n=1 Tax=Leptonychotes weddellii TaxID=9713 RepID=A0A7F8RVN0_LEPWE|nr:uncharacterized protein LOC115944952 [Leptonychotes weddellii]